MIDKNIINNPKEYDIQTLHKIIQINNKNSEIGFTDIILSAFLSILYMPYLGVRIYRAKNQLKELETILIENPDKFKEFKEFCENDKDENNKKDSTKLQLLLTQIEQTIAIKQVKNTKNNDKAEPDDTDSTQNLNENKNKKSKINKNNQQTKEDNPSNIQEMLKSITGKNNEKKIDDSEIIKSLNSNQTDTANKTINNNEVGQNTNTLNKAEINPPIDKK